MNTYSGLISVTGSGMDIDLYEGLLPEVRDDTEPLTFGKEGDQQLFTAVVHAQYPVVQRIGYACLSESAVDHYYDVDYWASMAYRGRRIIPAAMDKLMAHITECDTQFKALHFLIRDDNESSIKVATRMGATLDRPVFAQQSRYALGVEQYQQARRIRAAAHV
jgi:RimJ/RimL family protein N-acetyltransferase